MLKSVWYDWTVRMIHLDLQHIRNSSSIVQRRRQEGQGGRLPILQTRHVNCIKYDQLVSKKIIKIVATRSQIQDRHIIHNSISALALPQTHSAPQSP